MKDIFQLIDFLVHFYAKNLQNSDEMDNFLAKYSLSKIDLSRNRKLTHTDFQKRKKKKYQGTALKESATSFPCERKFHRGILPKPFRDWSLSTTYIVSEHRK